MTQATTEQTIKAARDYIARGWPTFVLSASKVPVALCGSQECEAHRGDPDASESCDCLTCHGFYAATLDPARAEEQIRRHPRGLLAVRTGAPSNTVVIDVDAPRGLATMQSLMQEDLLPRTVAQVTGSGGYHLVYAHPGGRVPGGGNKAGPKVDIKSDGGYIVVSPSLHPRTGRPYRWLAPFTDELTPLPPEWLHRLRPASVPTRMVPHNPRTTDRYALAALTGEIDKVLASAITGNRNDQLYSSAFCLGTLVPTGVLDEATVTAALYPAADAVGLVSEDGERQVRATIRSGLTSGARCPRTMQGAS